MRHPAGETITCTRVGADLGVTDELGNPTYGADLNFVISDCALAPVAGLETISDTGPTAITGYTIYAPYGTVIHKTDKFTIRGVAGWQVVGESDATGWRSPFDGGGRGVVFSVKRVS